MKFLALVNYHKEPEYRFARSKEDAQAFIDSVLKRGGCKTNMPVTTYITEIKKAVSHSDRAGRFISEDITSEILGER